MKTGADRFLFTLGVGSLIYGVYQLFIKDSVGWFAVNILIAAFVIGMAFQESK